MNASEPSSRFPSLVEIMALLLPLAAAAGIGFFLVSGLPNDEDARYRRARDDLRALRSLIIFSYVPSTRSGLQYFVDNGVIPFLPLDPWGRPYQYHMPGEERPYELFSLGPDGVESEDDLDIWDLYGGKTTTNRIRKTKDGT